jgi:short-subunit dehydrogenase
MNDDSRSPPVRSAVAIITGGSCRVAREVAGGLAGWEWPIVLVYLDHQALAEATVADIVAVGGTIVAVRANLADRLDVKRLFTESSAAFGHVDVVVHLTTEYAALLYEEAALCVREHGAIVCTSSARPIPPRVLSRLCERGVTVGWVPLEGVLDFLDTWGQKIVD